MKAGNYQLSVLVTHAFRLDGGAMFGSVPKTLWSRSIQADEQNRIGLVSRLLLLRQANRFAVVDLGLGTIWTEKEKQIYAMSSLLSEPLERVLHGVTDIILTHLHFDHAGGISHQDENGKVQLTFPNARVFLPEKNYSHAQKPGIRERASYLRHTVEPLQSANLCLTRDSMEILPGVRVFQSQGHTHGLQWVVIGFGEQAVAYPADLIPTAHHIPIPYVMGYDLCAETTMKEKELFLAQAEREKWTIVFEHDQETCAGRVFRDKDGRFSLGEKTPIPEHKTGG